MHKIRLRGAIENLAFEQRRRAALEAERQREIQKQKIQELQLTALKTFAANLENDPNTALPKTLSDISLLVAAIQALGQGFFHGIEDTGTGGAIKDQHGAIRGVVHEKERVMNAKQNKLVGSMSNDSLAQLAYKSRTGGLDEVQNSVVAVEKKAFQSNEQFLSEVKGLRSDIRDLPGKMPYDELKIHKLMLWLEHTGKRGNKTFKDYYKA